jgi:hypothetical protein
VRLVVSLVSDGRGEGGGGLGCWKTPCQSPMGTVVGAKMMAMIPRSRFVELSVRRRNRERGQEIGFGRFSGNERGGVSTRGYRWDVYYYSTVL